MTNNRHKVMGKVHFSPGELNTFLRQNAGTAHPPGADEIILNSDHCFYTVGYTNYNLIQIDFN
jgi:hypothetical protein